jgi:hypothetical protein
MRSILKLLLSKNPLRQMAETDRKVLAVCIGAAFAFWLILNLSRDYSITRPVAVAYLVDPERVLVGRMPERLDASITGSGWNLIWESLRPDPVPVEIDVRNRENLRLSALDLERQASRNLSSSKLVISLPGFESLPILTTPKEGKRVPVVSRIKVSFAEGHMAQKQPTMLPDSITISGSLDELEEITEWATEGLLVKNVNSDLRQAIALQAPPEGITISRNEVSFYLPVEAFIQKTILLPIRIANGRPGARYEFSPKMASLIFNMPQSAYESLNPEDFDLVADLSGRTVGQGGNDVPLSLLQKPDIVGSFRVEPQVVAYYLKE